MKIIFKKNKQFFKFFGMFMILLSSISLFGCSLFAAKSKDFSSENNELTITLTEDFEQSGSLNSTSSFTRGLTFTSKDKSVMIQIFKWNNDTFSAFVGPNLTEFGKIISNEKLNYDKENKLCYTNEYSSSDIYIKTFVFKTIDAYYEVDFRYVESGDDRVFNWAKSIKFSKDLVYDIDETLTDTKKVVLNTQDEASINIGASFIKIEDENNIYQKVLLSGQAYKTQFEFNKDEKSLYSNLIAYANDKGYTNSNNYTNRNLINKDYISFSSSLYATGVGVCDVIIYCFESNNNYYTVKFVSNNSDIELFDLYADSFTSN